MNFVGTAIACIAAVLIGIWLFSYAEVEIHAEKNALYGTWAVNVKYLFFKKKLKPGEKGRAEKDKVQTERQAASLSEYRYRIKDMLKIFDGLKDDAAKLLDYCTNKLIVFKRLDLSIEFGLDDPMETGILNGLLYGAVFEILGFVHNHSNIRASDVNISPNFDNECFKASFDCILRLKSVHITFMLVKLVKMYIKLKKLTKERK